MKNQKLVVGVVATLVLVGFFAAAFFYNQSQNEKYGFLAQENAETFVRPHSPTLGPKDAKVYLVEYLDPECESCRMFYPLVKQIMKDFEGKVRLVIRYVPYHGNSKFVIALLEATKKQDRYWQTLEVVFRTQPEWGSHHNPQPEKLWGFLTEVDGLDLSKLKEDMKDPALQEIIKIDMKDAQTLAVRGTPSFFVNGKKLEQFGIEPLRALIRSELAK
ncbi:MAG: protein-disulfide isomerase [Bacteriovoracaceae bacterium]|jgi:protein-disulfide isomerase